MIPITNRMFDDVSGYFHKWKIKINFFFGDKIFRFNDILKTGKIRKERSIVALHSMVTSYYAI